MKQKPSFKEIRKHIFKRKWEFSVTFLAVFALSYGLLHFNGLEPGNPPAPPQSQKAIERPTSFIETETTELPTLIQIPKVGVEALVVNPTSTNIRILDDALLEGVVRYPGSAKLGQEGNVLIFGHSSYLPIVKNQSYRAFNEIQNLKQGDEIYLYGEEGVFTYVVEKVEKVNIKDTEIPLRTSGHTLTLATCDVFGVESDRFIVTATLKTN